MSIPTKCGQRGCDAPAVVRYTWPGRDEAGACTEHALMVRNTSEAMGCHVQLIPITNDEMIAALLAGGGE
jgi:hypothetical protein